MFKLTNQITFNRPRRSMYIHRDSWTFDPACVYGAKSCVYTRLQPDKGDILSGTALITATHQIAFYVLKGGLIHTLIRTGKIIKTITLYTDDSTPRCYDLVKLLIAHLLVHRHAGKTPTEQNNVMNFIKELLAGFESDLRFELTVNHRGKILSYTTVLNPIDSNYDLYLNGEHRGNNPLGGYYFTEAEHLLDQVLVTTSKELNHVSAGE